MSEAGLPALKLPGSAHSAALMSPCGKPSGRLGGNLWPASKPQFKRDIADYLKYLEGLACRLPIDIVLNKQACAGDVRNFGADHVILATGARMEPPPFDGGNVLSVIQVLNGTEPKGEKILIMGGGVIGCETGVYLARKGKQVTICARQDSDELDMDTVDHNNRFMLLKIIKDAGITVLRATIPVRLENGGVVADQKGVQKKISMDSLVFAGRLFPDNDLGKSLGDMPNMYQHWRLREIRNDYGCRVGRVSGRTRN